MHERFSKVKQQLVKGICCYLRSGMFSGSEIELEIHKRFLLRMDAYFSNCFMCSIIVRFLWLQWFLITFKWCVKCDFFQFNHNDTKIKPNILQLSATSNLTKFIITQIFSLSFSLTQPKNHSLMLTKSLTCYFLLIFETKQTVLSA